VTDDKVQIIVPNGGVWGQPLRNFSFYPTPPRAELRFRIPATTNLDIAMAKAKAIVSAQPGVLKDPAPTVLLDYTAAENALEIAVSFSTEGEISAVKSDLIKTMHRGLEMGSLKEGAS
jgi:small conductance mechanosensitive channel